MVQELSNAMGKSLVELFGPPAMARQPWARQPLAPHKKEQPLAPHKKDQPLAPHKKEQPLAPQKPLAPVSQMYAAPRHCAVAADR